MHLEVIYRERNVIDYEGQVAVVTGAGRGLGRLYALELARRGAAVVVNDLGGTMHGEGADAGVADQVVKEIEQAGGRAVASYDSVDSPEGGQAIVDAAVDAFGRLDAVISNAGIFNSIPFDQLSADDWRRMLQVHSTAASTSVARVQGDGEAEYGRFVFICRRRATSASRWAHYAAAGTGSSAVQRHLNRGAAHGIFQYRMPTGFSRMVTETVGDEFLAESASCALSEPSW
jgi:NAD(P)-dependent dehydrogenase (short-subunit alcohol dehydrogenase family)